MNKYIEELNIDDRLLASYEEAEIFKSIHESSIVEIWHDTPRSLRSLKKGAAVRINNKPTRSGKMYSSPEMKTDISWFNSANSNETPYYFLPFTKTPEKSSLPVITLDQPETTLSKIEGCKPSLIENGIVIEKMSIEEDLGIYHLANTKAVRGFGYRYLYSINCLLKRKDGNEYEYSKVFDWTEKNTAISSFFKLIPLFEQDIHKNFEETKIPRLLLSCNAVMELFHLFLFFFNDQALAQIIPKKIDDIIHGRAFISHALNIVENSEYNKMVGGCIDGEGFARTPSYIFKNGCCKNIISKFSTCENANCTGSAYRFDYSVLPQTKAAKIFIEPGTLSEKEVLSSYDLIGRIETFQGMYESFDKNTFDFTALLHIKVYKYGECAGYCTKKVALNLISILSRISLLSNNLNYSGDGSFYIPSMVCEIEL
ncbi:MAG: metallopeptidase TldD-related protein [Eubacteriales bacterium]|jgi:predicted Zn-dependent protease|nr:metallopeptidase TldD-related protein [Eubacteriales bacterium]